ncbi:PREDICTED: RNA-binding protein 25-like, partial [Acanthisitta chloris]|uniref:RNA-binding protein 25-like n=1 Tax=Acanthisitta chloris TaxID=57068 RepID=UPI0004F0FADF
NSRETRERVERRAPTDQRRERRERRETCEVEGDVRREHESERHERTRETREAAAEADVKVHREIRELEPREDLRRRECPRECEEEERRICRRREREEPLRERRIDLQREQDLEVYERRSRERREREEPVRERRIDRERDQELEVYERRSRETREREEPVRERRINREQDLEVYERRSRQRREREERGVTATRRETSDQSILQVLEEEEERDEERSFYQTLEVDNSDLCLPGEEAAVTDLRVRYIPADPELRPQVQVVPQPCEPQTIAYLVHVIQNLSDPESTTYKIICQQPGSLGQPVCMLYVPSATTCAAKGDCCQAKSKEDRRLQRPEIPDTEKNQPQGDGSKATREKVPREPESSCQPTETERCIESLLAVFQRYAGKEGDTTTLSKKEFLAFMNTELAAFTKNQKDPGVVDRMMKKLDLNSDGQLDFQEFLNLIGGIAVACHNSLVLKAPGP